MTHKLKFYNQCHTHYIATPIFVVLNYTNFDVVLFQRIIITFNS